MIDVHIHVAPPNLPGAGSLSPVLKMSPETVAMEVRQQMQATGTTHALAMGEWNTSHEDPLGVNRTLAIAGLVPGLRAVGVADPTQTHDEHFVRCEEVLASGAVVALKAYLGYLNYEPSHPNYRRYYELAARFRVPVMFHTGDTYSPMAKLRYAHPLGVDDVAVDHPDARFVICHLGNPWLTDCAEVVYKNMNVWADLSGLVVGDKLGAEEAREAALELAQDVRRVIRYSERPNRFLYGTDWPLVDMYAYRDYVREALPPEYHEPIFVENAQRLFRLG